MSHPQAAIGVFDSGVGGLTVLKALRDRLPTEHVIYLGDTARLPYGTKSADTVARYAVQATRQFKRHPIKLIIIACNTASAVALPILTEALAPVPVLGVVEPGARAAVNTSRTGKIGVIATEGTVRGGAYVRAIRALAANHTVTQIPCPLFVALAEEGWTDGPVPELAAQRYLSGFAEGMDVLVLGCTHFPLLRGAISKAAGPGVTLVDSAEKTAIAAEMMLRERALISPGPAQERFYVTDAPERFVRIAPLFLGRSIDPALVELIDL